MREYFCKAAGCTLMDNPDLHQNFPDLDSFMKICVAIAYACQLLDLKVRYNLYRELTLLWFWMPKKVSFRYKVSHLARNIFFIATGTGVLCWKCMNFDLTDDPSVHHEICTTTEKKEDKPLIYYGLGLNEKKEVVCNCCWHVNPGKFDKTEDFYK